MGERQPETSKGPDKQGKDHEHADRRQSDQGGVRHLSAGHPGRDGRGWLLVIDEGDEHGPRIL
jgi:hypothetical protein